MQVCRYCLILALALLLGACQNRGGNAGAGGASEDRDAATKEAIDAEKDTMKVEKQDFENKVQSFLDKMDTRIENLKTKAKNERGALRVRTNREANRMVRDRDALKARFDEMKSASDVSWKDVRSEMDKTMARYDLAKH